MMITSNSAKEMIKGFEGLRLQAYQDAGGIWTIGYGHTSSVYPNMRITEAQANSLFESDIKKVEDHINKYNFELSKNQFDALVSWTFNLGVGTFDKVIVPLLLVHGPADESIPYKMEKYYYANGQPLQGLIKRRKIEAELYRKGAKKRYYILMILIIIVITLLIYHYV